MMREDELEKWRAARDTAFDEEAMEAGLDPNPSRELSYALNTRAGEIIFDWLIQRIATEDPILMGGGTMSENAVYSAGRASVLHDLRLARNANLEG